MYTRIYVLIRIWQTSEINPYPKYSPSAVQVINNFAQVFTFFWTCWKE